MDSSKNTPPPAKEAALPPKSYHGTIYGVTVPRSRRRRGDMHSPVVEREIDDALRALQKKAGLLRPTRSMDPSLLLYPGGRCHSLTEIAKASGLSPEGVRVIQDRALRKFRNFLYRIGIKDFNTLDKPSHTASA